LDGVQRQVAALPRPEPDFIFQHVYAELPARLEHQRAELREGQ
jgi:TPP-dependent pyruvate/acetoin dehydrogenase alpha subunit